MLQECSTRGKKRFSNFDEGVRRPVAQGKTLVRLIFPSTKVVMVGDRDGAA